MNIQTERREDQTARLTVQVDAERLNEAKREAAREISKKVNIPGFRKGKAPYRVLSNYIGDEYITEEAVELLSQTVYREVITQVDFEPYGPGALDEYDVEQEAPVFIYTVPLQPEVDLKEYRDVRLDYEAPAVTDEMVEKSLRNLQEQHAVVEESQHPARLGDRVTMDVHSFFISEHEDEEPAEEDAEPEAPVEAEVEQEAADMEWEGAPATDEAVDVHEHSHDEPYIHEHDLQLILDEQDEPIPGFNEQVVGAAPGTSLNFVLTVPDDVEKYPNEAGRTVEFSIEVKKVENITLPPLNDELAARATEDEDEPLSLLELRVRIRENLERMVLDEYDNDYKRRALDELVNLAEIKFPEAIVADEVEALLRDLDRRLRQQGITLEDYMKIYGKTIQDLYGDYRDLAVLRVKRGLVMRELVKLEGVGVNDGDIDAEIDRLAMTFEAEEQQESFRQMFVRQPNMRLSMQDDLLTNKVMDRVAAIAKGEAPALEAAAAETSNAQPEEVDSTPAVDETAAASDESESTEETA